MSQHTLPSEPRNPAPSATRRVATLAPWVAVFALTSGCGNFLYAIDVNSAASKLEEARSLGAEQYAPYEYYMAEQHLEKARSEASEADYGDAVELSSEAEEYAEKAIALSRQAQRGAGR